MNPEIRPQKFTTTTVKLGAIFEKNRRSTVILKINGATPQLDQNLKPTTYLSGHFFIYIYIYILILVTYPVYTIFVFPKHNLIILM